MFFVHELDFICLRTVVNIMTGSLLTQDIFTQIPPSICINIYILIGYHKTYVTSGFLHQLAHRSRALTVARQTPHVSDSN